MLPAIPLQTRIVTATFGLAVALASGCGPSSPDTNAMVDAAVQPPRDSAPPAPDSAPQCTGPSTVASEYDDIPGLKSANNPWDAGAQEWQVSFELEPEGAVWELRLHPGRGQLSDPITPGNYIIGPEDADFATCAVCAYIRVPGSDEWFMADFGILTLTTIDNTGNIDVIAGSIEDASYVAFELEATGASCDLDSECVNTTCAANMQCEAQAATNTCGTTISNVAFRTP